MTATHPQADPNEQTQKNGDLPDPKDDKKGKKEKPKYTEDVNDPAYVEPRLRPDWTPDQPG